MAKPGSGEASARDGIVCKQQDILRAGQEHNSRSRRILALGCKNLRRLV